MNVSRWLTLGEDNLLRFQKCDVLPEVQISSKKVSILLVPISFQGNFSISKFSYTANMFRIPEPPFHVPQPTAIYFSTRDNYPTENTLN